MSSISDFSRPQSDFSRPQNAESLRAPLLNKKSYRSEVPMTQLSPTTQKFASRAVQKQVRNLGNKASRAASLSGICIGAALLIKILSIAKVVAFVGFSLAGAAVAVTPLGWAALGLAALAIGILVIRHLIQKRNNMETDFKQQVGEKALMTTATATVTVGSVISLVIGAMVLIGMAKSGVVLPVGNLPSGRESEQRN